MGPTLKESAQAKKNGANLSTIFNRLQKFEKRVETLQQGEGSMPGNRAIRWAMQ